MNKKVFIILLNYNGYEDTIEAVKSLEEITYNNYEIVVVDNASTNSSFEILKKEMGDRHHVIASGANKGFAFGNNVGIKFAMENGADYVLLINNDTTVEKDFLEHLVESAEEDEKVGLTTGLILNYYNKDIIWYGGGELNWNKFYGYHINEGKELKDTIQEKKEITFATGCLMLIKREVIEKIGGLPEEYFMYYEDVDFCAKLMENKYKIIYDPASIIYHKISAASGEAESPFAIEWNTRNRLKFMNKYKNNTSYLKFKSIKTYFYLTRIIKSFNYIKENRNDKFKALIKGLR